MSRNHFGALNTIKKFVIFVAGVGGIGLILVIFPQAAAAGPADEIKYLQESAAVIESCMECHSQKDLTAVRNEETVSLYVSPQSYSESIHGRNACTSCHPEKDPDVDHTVSASRGELQLQVQQACGGCHDEVAAEYRRSIHGLRAASGKDTAFCSDCHGSHNILLKENPKAAYFRTNLPKQCGQCHQDNAWETYRYSFHGIANKFGYPKAATCADCHGNHEILPEEDPQSLVSVENRPETCAQCHSYAREGFAKGKEHITPMDKENAFPVWLVWKIFIAIILFDAVKDGTIVIFELIRQLRVLIAARKAKKYSSSGISY